MAKITIYPKDGSPAERFETSNKVEITEVGLKFDDPEIEMPVVRTFDRISSFEISVDVTDEMAEHSASYQRYKSDSVAKNKTAAQWTV
tara:strand:+ start:73 stop:336 length:264 start_codon:yes stop_codon:yes gene_type:complete